MRVKIKIIKNFSWGLVLFIVKYDFLVCLILFLLSFLFSGFLFYKYSILTDKIEIEEIDQSFLIKEQTYQEILRIWQDYEQKFQQAGLKEYPNLFQPAPASLIFEPESELTE